MAYYYSKLRYFLLAFAFRISSRRGCKINVGMRIGNKTPYSEQTPGRRWESDVVRTLFTDMSDAIGRKYSPHERVVSVCMGFFFLITLSSREKVIFKTLILLVATVVYVYYSIVNHNYYANVNDTYARDCKMMN